MAKKLEYEIGVDASKGVSGLKQFAGAAKKELAAVSDELEDTSSNAEKVARVLGDMASKMETELRGAAIAADALGQALGTELAGRADFDQIVGDLNRMGLSFDEITADADTLAAALRELDRVGNLDIKTDVTGTAETELADIQGEVRDLDGRKAEVEVTADTSQFRGELDEIGDRLQNLPGALGGLGQALGPLAAGGGAVVGTAAIAGSLFLAANSTADMALEAQTFATLTGSSVEDASRLLSVLRSAGIEYNDIADITVQINQALEQQPELAARLGINIDDGRDAAERLLQVMQLNEQGLINMTDQSTLFGEEGIRQMAGVKARIDDITRALLNVPEGAIITPEMVKEASALKAQIAEIQLRFQAVTTEIGSDLMPLLIKAAELAGAITDALETEPAGGGISISDVLFWMPGINAMNTFLEGSEELKGSLAPGAFQDTADAMGGMSEEMTAIASASKTFVKAQKPMSDMPKTWRTAEAAVRRMRQGLDPTADQLQAVLVLTQQYGIEATEVYNRAAAAIDETNASLRDTDAAAKAAMVSIPGLAGVFENLTADELEAAKEAKAFAVSIADAQLALNDMASAFGEMARKEGAIEAAFDIGDAPFEAEKNASNLAVAIEELAAFVREHGPPISDGINDLTKIDFSHGEVDVAPFIAKIEAIKGPIQRAVADAFLTGGAPAAQATAQGLIAAIHDSLDGAISTQELDTLIFGEDGYTGVIKIAVDQASLAKAQAMLQLLTGLPGADPLWVAQVALDLQADKLTPEAAQVLIAQQLGAAGLQVPSTMLPPDGPSLTEAKRQADEFYRRNPTIVHSAVGKPSNAADVWRDTQNKLFKLPPLQLQTALKIPVVGGVFNLDTGGTAGGSGGIAGERGPEILNGKYLTTGPTYVPPGTRVTSRKQTARILRTRGTQGLKRYDQGGIVGGPHTLNINVNAAVVGNRWDVARTVRRAERDMTRLLGTRV